MGTKSTYKAMYDIVDQVKEGTSHPGKIKSMITKHLSEQDFKYDIVLASIWVNTTQ